MTVSRLRGYPELIDVEDVEWMDDLSKGAYGSKVIKSTVRDTVNITSWPPPPRQADKIRILYVVQRACIRKKYLKKIF